MIKVVIAAAGVGARLGSNIPKQFLELKGEQILKRTVFAFQSMDMVDEIVVTVPKGYAQVVAGYGFDKVRHVVEGGKDRGASVYRALKRLPQDTRTVLIHDGVRPFVTPALIQAVADAAATHGAAIACTPVTDTIKQVSCPQGNDPALIIKNTIDRRPLWRAQTPQGFTYNTILEAYEKAEKDGILHQATDDSMLVERLGIPVHVVPCSPQNMKITTAEDLIIAEVFLA